MRATELTLENDKQTFDFGKGPVPAHKHPNGGGWVADSANVSQYAYVGKDARVFDRAEVVGPVQIYGDARIYGDAKLYG